MFLCDKPTQNPAYAKQTLVLRKDTRSFFEYIGAKRVRKPVIRTKTGNRPAGRFFVLKERDLKGR